MRSLINLQFSFIITILQIPHWLKKGKKSANSTSTKSFSFIRNSYQLVKIIFVLCCKTSPLSMHLPERLWIRLCQWPLLQNYRPPSADTLSVISRVSFVSGQTGASRHLGASSCHRLCDPLQWWLAVTIKYLSVYYIYIYIYICLVDFFPSALWNSIYKR